MTTPASVLWLPPSAWVSLVRAHTLGSRVNGIDWTFCFGNGRSRLERPWVYLVAFGRVRCAVPVGGLRRSVVGSWLDVTDLRALRRVTLAQETPPERRPPDAMWLGVRPVAWTPADEVPFDGWTIEDVPECTRAAYDLASAPAALPTAPRAVAPAQGPFDARPIGDRLASLINGNVPQATVAIRVMPTAPASSTTETEEPTWIHVQPQSLGGATASDRSEAPSTTWASASTSPATGSGAPTPPASTAARGTEAATTAAPADPEPAPASVPEPIPLDEIRAWLTGPSSRTREALPQLRTIAERGAFGGVDSGAIPHDVELAVLGALAALQTATDPQGLRDAWASLWNFGPTRLWAASVAGLRRASTPAEAIRLLPEVVGRLLCQEGAPLGEVLLDFLQDERLGSDAVAEAVRALDPSVRARCADAIARVDRGKATALPLQDAPRAAAASSPALAPVEAAVGSPAVAVDAAAPNPRATRAPRLPKGAAPAPSSDPSPLPGAPPAPTGRSTPSAKGGARKTPKELRTVEPVQLGLLGLK